MIAACLDQPPRPDPGPPGVDAFVPLPDVGSGSGFDAFVADPEHALEPGGTGDGRIPDTLCRSSSTPEGVKVNPGGVKVNPGGVKVNPGGVRRTRDRTNRVER